MQVFGRYLRRHHVALLALFIALGGTSYAAVALPKNSVGTKQLKKNAVTSAKVKNGSLKESDFKAGELPQGPKGDTGAQGPKGDTGAKGEKGDEGDAATVGIVDEIEATTANDSADAKTATATCPAGTLAIGGHRTNNADGLPIALVQSREDHSTGVSRWIVRAVEVNPPGVVGNWSLTVFATCVG